MTEPDRTIQLEEAEEILKEFEVKDMTLFFEGQSIVVDVKEKDIKLEFVSLRESSSVEISEHKSWTTVSRYLIHTGGEVLEVETEGPFQLDIEGLGTEELGASIEHDDKESR